MKRTWDDSTWENPDEPDPDITGGAILWAGVAILTLVAIGICVGIYAYFEHYT